MTDCFCVQHLSALWGLWWSKLQLQKRLVLPGHNQQHITAGKDSASSSQSSSFAFPVCQIHLFLVVSTPGYIWIIVGFFVFEHLVWDCITSEHVVQTLAPSPKLTWTLFNLYTVFLSQYPSEKVKTDRWGFFFRLILNLKSMISVNKRSSKIPKLYFCFFICSLPCIVWCCSIELSGRSWCPSGLWGSSSVSNWSCSSPSGKNGSVIVIALGFEPFHFSL